MLATLPISGSDRDRRSVSRSAPWSLALSTVAAVALFFATEAPVHADADVGADDTSALCDTGSLSSTDQRFEHHRSHRRSHCSDQSAEGCPIRRARRARRGCGMRSWRWRRARWYRGHRGHRGLFRHFGKLSLGVTKGYGGNKDQRMRESGMFARLSLTRRISAELEFSGAFEGHHHRRGDRDRDDRDGRDPDGRDDGDRGDRDDRDRRHHDGSGDYAIGGGLLMHAAPGARISPYLSVSGGRVVSLDGETDTFVLKNYGEVGAGLSVRVTRRLSLEADVRAGRRFIHDGDKAGSDDSRDRGERYHRGRVKAVFQF